jgi:hypothetical protein
LLIPIILGEQTNAMDHHIGGFVTIPPAVPGIVYEIHHFTPTLNGVRYLLIRIRLFPDVGAPVYLVVTGTMNTIDETSKVPQDSGFRPGFR